MSKIVTKNEKQTFNLGKKLAKKLKGGEIIALFGDLGSGKTTFIKGIAQGLGIKKIVTSPTFVLLKIYKISDFRFQISDLIHIDAYRVKNAQQLVDIGILDYFNRPDTACVIEWAEKVKDILPKKRINISFKHGGTENERIIKMNEIFPSLERRG